MSQSTVMDGAVRTVSARVDVDHLDDVLSDSFPASDPPSWNSGIARARPINSSTPGDMRGAQETSPAIASGRTMAAS
jgi:hypothetical protein